MKFTFISSFASCDHLIHLMLQESRRQHLEKKARMEGEMKEAEIEMMNMQQDSNIRYSVKRSAL